MGLLDRAVRYVPKIFEGAYRARAAHSEAIAKTAKALGLARRPEVATLAARADLALGRARRLEADRDDGTETA